MAKWRCLWFTVLQRQYGNNVTNVKTRFVI